MNEKIKNIINSVKKPKFIIILGICGILLICLTSFSTPKKETGSSEIKEETLLEYKQNLELETENLIKKITSYQEVTVVITLQTGYIYNYADETKLNQSNKEGEGEKDITTDSEQKYIIVTDSSGNEQALLVNCNLPEIRGVAVVYSGKNYEALNEKIEEALMATLNVSSKRIYISGEGGK